MNLPYTTSKFMPSPKARWLITTLLLLLFVYIFITTAWVCDDAFITFRTVDNFVSGHGLRWNIDERVQAYTHPLWMFIIALFYSITSEVYFTSLAVSLLFSSFAVIILLLQIKHTVMKILIIALLLSSKAFTDYTSSGLENPLSYFLIMIFLYLYFKDKYDSKNILYLSLVSSSILLTRLDLAIIITPPLIHAIYKYIKIERSLGATNDPAKILIIGFLPFIIWELFSLVYYGSLIPNTAYAKLCTGIPFNEILSQGLAYIKVSTLYDPITSIVIAISLALSFTRVNNRRLLLAIGVALYLIWLTTIGGDFMAGRMLAVPFLLAVILISHAKIKNRAAAFIILLIVTYNVSIPHTPIKNTKAYSSAIHWNDPQSKGVADERGVYYETCGLLNIGRGGEPSVPFVGQGKAIRKYNKPYYICRCIGYTGYYAGPQTYIVDRMALADPFLSRIRCSRDGKWRIGHFGRDLPVGYIESLKNDTNVVADHDLSELYAAVKIITRDYIFSKQRLAEILKLNLGYYKHHCESNNYAVDYDSHLSDLILYDTLFVYDEPSLQPVNYLPGDLNGDSLITSRDLSYLKLLFYGLKPQIPIAATVDSFTFYPAADVNGDCRISYEDLSYLQNFILGTTKSLDHCPNIKPRESLIAYMSGN